MISYKRCQAASLSLSRLYPWANTHSNPFRPVSALERNRSTLAFSILRAIIAVGKAEMSAARWWNSVLPSSVGV